jgi:hypothetical protein
MADLDPIVSQTLERIRLGREDQRSRLTKYNNSYEVWRAIEKTNRSEPWQSKLRVPYAMQTIDTALVNIVTGLPQPVVRPRHPDVSLNAKAMQKVLSYYVDEDHLAEKQPLFAQQGLIFGVTAAKNHWLYKTVQRPGRAFQNNQEGGVYEGPMTLQDLVVRDGPTFEPWNIYHMFWEPGSRDVDDAGYVVLQSYLSKEDCRKLECTVSHSQSDAPCNGVLHNVDELLATGAAPKPDSSAQNRVNEDETNRFKDRFLLEEIWTDETWTIVGNKQVLMRQQANPYWHGKKPVVVAQVRPDLFEMVGIAETELIDHLQQAQWTLQRATFDNLLLTVQRGLTYREGGVTDPNDLQLRPRFKWPVTDHDDIRPFEVQPIGSDIFSERQRLQSDMQLVTGINPYVSGSDLQTVDQNTATGVTALQEVASRLLRFKAAMLQNKGYQRSYEMWGDMTQQFMDKSVWVEIVGQDGPQWMEVPPNAVMGHFNYRIQGSEESLSQQQERGEAIALLNAFAPLLQVRPDIDIKPILERVATAYDFDNPEQLFKQPQPQQPAAPGGQDAMYNILGPRIGDVPQRNSYMQQGGVQMDPKLANALSTIRQN